MKTLFKTLVVLLLAFTTNLSAQTIEGGGGVVVLSSGADPNAIAGLATQTWGQGESVLAHDANTGVLWIYNDANAGGSKWEVFASGATTVSYVASSRTLTINGVDQILPFANGTDPGLLGGVNDQVNGADISLSAVGIITTSPNIDELPQATGVDLSSDVIMIWDDSETTMKKVIPDDLGDGNGIYGGSGNISGSVNVFGTGNLLFGNTGSFTVVNTGQISISSAGAGNNTTLNSANDLRLGSSDGGLLTLGHLTGSVAETIRIGNDANDVFQIQAIDYTGLSDGDVFVVTDVTTGEVGVAAASLFADGTGTDDQALTVETNATQVRLALEDGGEVNINATGDASVTEIGGELFIGTVDNTSGYNSHADAGAGGVPLGGYFTALITNTMGAVPGTRIKRLF